MSGSEDVLVRSVVWSAITKRYTLIFDVLY